MSYRADKLGDGRTDGLTDGRTQATTIPEGQYWPWVKNETQFAFCDVWYYLISASSFWVILHALGQSYNDYSANEATLKYKGKTIWGLQYNHNKTKHNKTMFKVYGTYSNPILNTHCHWSYVSCINLLTKTWMVWDQLMDFQFTCQHKLAHIFSTPILASVE